MRLTQILTESSTETFEKDDLANLANQIKTNCQPWLEESRNGQIILYRGITRNFVSELAYKVPIRRNRQALGYALLRRIYDQYLLKGSPIKRENSISTTTSKAVAAAFGTVSIVIPEGNFDYLWSPEIVDWGTGDIEDFDLLDYRDALLDSDFSNLDQDALEALDKTITRLRSSLQLNTGLDQVPKGYEVMLRTDYNVYLLSLVAYNEVMKVISNKQFI